MDVFELQMSHAYREWKKLCEVPQTKS